MVEMEIYKNSRILVTGHTGFKGSWLVVMLRLLGAEVFGVSADIGQTSPILQNEFDREHGFKLDIREREKLSELMGVIQPDLVFHLAAQSLVLDSYAKPIDTFDINLVGTMNVLSSLDSISKTQGVILATTDKVYRNLESGTHFSEEDPLGGLDPYSASKSCASILISAWQQLPNYENMKIVDVRAGNVIGGGDRAENRLIPDLLKAAINQETVCLRNPDSIRPWQHVLEPLHGYLLAGEKILQKQYLQNAYNFGPNLNSELSVAEVADIFKGEFKNLDLDLRQTVPPLLKESQILKLDSTRASEDLNWESKFTPEEAIKKTVAWEKAVHSKSDSPLTATERQVSDYYAQNL